MVRKRRSASASGSAKGRHWRTQAPSQVATLMRQCFDKILKSGLNMEKYIRDWSFIDSGSSVHLMSKVDPTAEEQDTITISQDPNTIITATRTIRTTEQAVVYVQDSDTLVTVQLLRFSGRAVAGKNYAKKRICLPIARRPRASMGPTRENHMQVRQFRTWRTSLLRCRLCIGRPTAVFGFGRPSAQKRIK